jgi:hypothetical protein
VSRGKQTPPRKIDLESLARSYTEEGIRRLGGYVVSPQTKPEVAIEAIKILLDRGWGKPKQIKTSTHTGPDGGAVNLVMRHIHEGKPPGEK